MRISAIVIAKNEENMIADCLDSLSFCDEIIVVDNGSQDRTVDVSERLGAKVLKLDSESFAQLRNFGFSKASGDWVLYVDADERVSNELRKSIESVIRSRSIAWGPVTPSSHPMSSVTGSLRALDGTPSGRATPKIPVAYRIKRKNFYLGNYEWPYIEHPQRLFKKDKLKEWKGQLHESPIVDGDTGDLDGFLLHFTHRDLSSMLDKTNKWSDIEARLRLLANHPKMSWWRFPRVMTWAFFNSYILQSGWKVGTAGLIESIYQAFSIFITYAKLWEMQNKKSLPRQGLGGQVK